jgi:GNAT superfamily N-acetyltransferase
VISQPVSDSIRLAEATTDAEILACLPVLRELRQYIGHAGDFVGQVRRQQEEGYRLMAAWQADRVVACAGFSVRENLVSGRVIHVDELVTTRSARSQGLGKRLLSALTDEARNNGCRAVVLDCGIRNARAHRFYFREGMRITSFRFALSLAPMPGDETR